MREKRGANPRGYLFSRIIADATLTSSMAKVKERLKPYPGLALEREGTSLLYSMNPGNSDDHFFMLELGSESVAITVYSKLSPMRFLQETMLRLLGVMQTLSECYEAKLESLYPYLIMTIAEQHLDALAYERKREETAMPDMILSKRLIALIGENAVLREERDSARRSFERVVLRAVVLSSVADHSVDSIAARLGIDRRAVVAALDGAEDAGFRVVSTGRGTFNLVRT